MAGLMDKMNETDTQNDMKASLSSMFNKKPAAPKAAPVAQAAPVAAPAAAEQPAKTVQVGRPVYKYANGRKLKQVTTKLCEDNVDWLFKYAESIGVHSGQISYMLNRLIEEKRGITDFLKEN